MKRVNTLSIYYCDLGNHHVKDYTDNDLIHVCRNCREAASKGVAEIRRQAELTREHQQLLHDQRSERSPYRFIPYVTLAIITVLAVLGFCL